jgi:hypothetical protein
MKNEIEIIEENLTEFVKLSDYLQNFGISTNILDVVLAINNSISDLLDIANNEAKSHANTIERLNDEIESHNITLKKLNAYQDKYMILLDNHIKLQESK